MGYTHYWNYNPNNIKSTEELRKKFKKASSLIAKFYKFTKNQKKAHGDCAGGYYQEQPFKICGGFGEGIPIINESMIWFNGDKSNGMSHETFCINIFDQKEPNGFNFCKTARKPYDIMVCFSLLAFKYTFNDLDVFHFSSDGTNADWARAYAIFKAYTGITPEEFIYEEEEAA